MRGRLVIYFFLYSFPSIRLGRRIRFRLVIVPSGKKMDVSESAVDFFKGVGRSGWGAAGRRAAGRGGGRRVRGQNGPHGTYSSRLSASVCLSAGQERPVGAKLAA